jgi:hypothetical protein
MDDDALLPPTEKLMANASDMIPRAKNAVKPTISFIDIATTVSHCPSAITAIAAETIVTT